MAFKYKAYGSVSEILRDLPREPAVVSIVIVALPFIIYILWRTSFLRTLFITPMALSYIIWSGIRKHTKKRELEMRIREGYEGMAGKKTGLADIMGYGGYLSMVIFGILIIKKAFFLSLVVSQSMMPTLMVSDLVVVESLSTGSIEVGDILVFRPSGYGYSITHRVVNIDDGKIRTKGDNSVVVDSWVLTDKNIEGKLLTVNGNPVVIKNVGTYFMPTLVYAVGSDPTYDLIRSTIQTVHVYGPMVLLVILLLILMSTFEGKKRYRRAYE